MQSIDDELEAVFREQMLLELMIEAGGETTGVADVRGGPIAPSWPGSPPLYRNVVEMHRDGLKVRLGRHVEACGAMFRNIAANLLQYGREPLHFSFAMEEPAVPYGALAGNWLEDVGWSYGDMDRAIRAMRVCIEIAEHRVCELRNADGLES
jgi:hypothetical protein